ncbi:MAG TPA: TylF/MycF family methyltransferase [Armatimonadota bacterium]|jgi:hypothetical protein
MDTCEELYLDLMKKCLTNWIYRDAEAQIRTPGRGLRRLIGLPGRLARRLKSGQLRSNPSSVPRGEGREDGADWPAYAHTMVGLHRLNNIQFCVESVLNDNVPGDLIETGVWRGGAAIFMRAVLKAHRVTDRRVWAADSFEGLPAPNAKRYPQDASAAFNTYARLAVSLEEVRANFDRYGLLDDQVRFLKGWFRDTLPTAPINRLAVIRLDGDMYESTMDGLVNLYPKLSPGGYLIVDDYGAIEACRQAVHDFRQANGINEEIVPVDWTGAYWRRAR